MSKAKVFTKEDGVTKEDLEALMHSLRVSRNRFGGLCGVSSNTLNWWLRERKIPQQRLVDLAEPLVKSLGTRPELTAQDRRVKEFYQKLFGVPLEELARRSSALQFTSAISGFRSFEPDAKEPGAIAGQASKPAFHGPGYVNILNNFSAEELVEALEKKGWEVSLKRKEKKPS